MGRKDETMTQVCNFCQGHGYRFSMIDQGSWLSELKEVCKDCLGEEE